MTDKPNDKQKEKPLVFCENCRYYACDMEKCGFKKGEKVTPVEITDVYASPKEDNKHNDCPHYEEPREYSTIDQVAFFMIFPAGFFAVIFESGLFGILALLLFIYFIWRHSS